MNPHRSHPLSPTALLRGLWQQRDLIRQMTWREVLGRYRGSAMGLAWSFFNPILMLAVYTFVFSGVFKARWGETAGSGGHGEFALILFVGMIVHALFAEVLNRAPGLVLGNANYVKKVVFPLEILPLTSLGAALFHALVSIAVLLLASLFVYGGVPWTAVLVPVVLVPLAVLTLGLAWFLASLGVYLRDVGQTIGIITTVMLFLAPVFYPVTALPEEFRVLIMLNPLTFIIEQAREVLVWGRWPDWSGLAIYFVVSGVVAWLGCAWFQRTRKGFADVL